MLVLNDANKNKHLNNCIHIIEHLLWIVHGLYLISFQLIPQSYERGTFIIPFINVTKAKKGNDTIQSHRAGI